MWVFWTSDRLSLECEQMKISSDLLDTFNHPIRCDLYRCLDNFNPSPFLRVCFPGSGESFQELCI